MHGKIGPNILVTGTPGVGKTTLANLVCERTGLHHVVVGELAEEHNCYDGYDEELKCNILDEEKLLDEMEDMMAEGGRVVDYHGSDFFPERFFDIVFVLRTNNTVLYDRLVARGYSGKKLENNISCEIMNVLLEEARDSYKEEIVHELPSDSPDQLEDGVERICQWVEAWKRDNTVAMS